MDADRGEHQEHQADRGRHPFAVAVGEVRDAHAEDGPDQDEQGLADPEGQQADEETQHPAIPPGQDHNCCDGSHNSGWVLNRDERDARDRPLPLLGNDPLSF
ncbi:hypothetical protein [Streptomyces tendae]|uniref:hypothetical protein n=1 Tax=Streptomyces tendae TaxID=1932 RepID=UPI0038510573